MKAAEKHARDYFIRDHGITQETLDSFGIVFRENGVVVLPYEGRLRERIDLPVAPSNGKRFVWGASDVAITPFNVDDGHKKVVFITEGESDAMRLWQDLPDHSRAGVIGLPGVEAWKDEWEPRFEGAEKIYVVLDNSTGYDDPQQVERAWRKMRAVLGNRCRRVYLREDCKDLTEFLEKYGYKMFAKLVKEEATAGRQHWQSLDLTKPPADPDWLMQGVMARGQTTALIGQAWGGKSFWYLGLIAAMIHGDKVYCGQSLHTDPGAKILVIDEENPPTVPIWRMRKLGLTEEDLSTGRIRYICRQGVRLDDHAEEIMDEVTHLEPDLVIFDSFDRLHRLGDQVNASGAVSAIFTECLMPIAQASNAAVLLLHHENKAPAPAKSGPPPFRSFAQRSRGSGALAEAADQGLIMEMDGQDNELKHLLMGGSRSSSVNPGTTLFSFRITDVGKDIQIQADHQMGHPTGDDDDDTF